MPPDINWKDEAAVQNRIAAFDIGIATLLNTESQRSKSAFKLKQYMNNGVPVLSADVAENNFFLQHGVNGFLCSTAEDFRNRIIEFNFMDNYTYNTFSKRAAESAGYFNHELYCTTLLKVFENCKETVHHNTARKAQQVL